MSRASAIGQKHTYYPPSTNLNYWIAENIIALVHNAKITLVMPLMALTVIVATAAIAGWFRQIGNETNG